jgi:phosphatidylglycerophosphate synthase
MADRITARQRHIRTEKPSRRYSIEVGADPTAAGSSRDATNLLLAQRRTQGWAPKAWTVFLLHCAQRSTQQAQAHPRAAAELTAFHAAIIALTGGRAWCWPTLSWALALTHLGMLEDQQRVGAANLVSLTRAHLPLAAPRLGRWLGLVALVSDKADGILARRGGVTPFGFYADALADAAFWTWFALHREPDPRVRAAALAAWAAPVLAVTAISVARGRMVEAPHPVWLRPAAGMQAVLALRAWRASPA